MANGSESHGDVDTEVAWRQLLTQLMGNPLEKVNSAAQNWITLLSTLISVSTIFGLIQGRDSLAKLILPFQIALAVVIFFTFGLLFLAIYNGSKVAQGGEERLLKERILNTGDFMAWYQKFLQGAVYHLRLSRIFGFASIVFLIIAFMINLFGPVGLGPGISILAVQRNGVVVCGTLAKDSAGNLSLDRVKLPSIILKDIVSYNVVSTCP